MSENAISDTASDSRRATFKTWLRAQVGRDDPIGDLASDYLEDGTAPENVVSYDALESYVRGKIMRWKGYLHPDVQVALRDAWTEFEATSTSTPPGSSGGDLVPRAPLAVGVFCFAGGFTLGVRRAGFEVLGHLETSSYGVATSLRNHPGLDVRTKVDAWQAERYRERQVDLVYGNPPCAPWSSAGSKRRDLGPARDYSLGYDPRDERVGCVRHVMGLLDSIAPRALAWESVRRAWTAGEPFLREMAAYANARGYHVQVVLHDGYDCGLPQHRRRAFFVASKVRIDWRPLVRSHLAPRTVGEALSNLLDEPREVAGMWETESQCLEHTPPGGKTRATYEKLFAGLGGAGRPGFLRVRLDLDRPAPAATGGPVWYHPVEHRKMSVRETQVLCGYPPDYEFVCSRDLKYKQMAQAVLPPVGEWLGRAIREALERGESPPALGLDVVDLEP